MKLWSVGTAVNFKMNQKRKILKLHKQSFKRVHSYCHRIYGNLYVSFMFKLLGAFVELMIFFLLVN